MLAAHAFRTRSIVVLGNLLAFVLAGGMAAGQAAYPDVTNTRRSYVDFNVEVVRGFVLRTTPSFECFSVNAYESTIVHHTSLSGAPVHRWPTLTNPVSIAFDGADLLVVGQGNHALARHDSATGVMTDVIMLGSEPADIVVDDETQKAYVSCMGDDSVWEIDVSGTTFVKGTVWSARSTTHPLPLKRPRFLSLDTGADGTSDNAVYVAPLLSGNNTLTTRHQNYLPKGVLDGNDPTYFVANIVTGERGLPDVDLFRLTPATGAVQTVLRQVGSLVTAHGKNPATGHYWVLNVEEHNLGVGLSEPDLRGKFATNSLAIASSLPTSGTPVVPGTRIDLDDTTTGGTPTYQDYLSVSFPYALDFTASGQAIIGSATTPLVVVLDSAGNRLRGLELANSGSIQGRVVRTVKYHGSNVLAYCQQTSNIVVFSLSPYSHLPVGSMSLGNDPTPASVKAGRGIWYDAVRSMDGRTSCNTCHPQGGADGLVWQIGDVPVDDKGPLVTQPLLGIEDTFPYHWRGERNLSDFNGAFPGLLGTAAELNATELADFEEFVFSLRPHANPLQILDRKVHDTLMPEPQGEGIVATPLVGSAIHGLDLFQNRAANSSGACVRCHTLPTGSNGEFMPDHFDAMPTRTNFEVAHLSNQMSLKRQPVVGVQVVGQATPLPSNLLGSGTAGDGTNTNLFDFVNRFFLGTTFGGLSNPITDQEVADFTTFVHLFDTGTAPSVHWAVRLNQATSLANTTLVRNNLLVQAASGWVGVVARGTYPVGVPPVPVAVNWYYDASLQRMVPDRTSFPSGTLVNQTWQQFDLATQAGLADNVFFGVPPGNERRLGADMDHDGLDYGAELALVPPADPWNPDTDGDGYEDGYEIANGSTATNASSVPADTTPPTLVGGKVQIDFTSAKVSKLYFRTSEPVRWTLTLFATGWPDVVDSRKTYDTTHSAVVQALHPSPNLTVSPNMPIMYTWRLVLTDRAGLTTVIDNNHGVDQPDVFAGDIVMLGSPVVGSLTLSNEMRWPDSYSADVEIRIVNYEGLVVPIAVAESVPILQVLKLVPGTANDWERVPDSDLMPSTGTYNDFFMAINGLGTPPVSYSQNVLDGPYLVLPPTSVASNGVSTTSFLVKGLNPNQPILVNVFGALWDDAGTMTPPPNSVPIFLSSTFARYFNFPATPKHLRSRQSSL